MLPVPLHTGQVLATEKKPCWVRTCPRPPHCWQVSGCLLPSEPVPEQSSQTFGAANRDLTLDAEDGFLELQAHIVLEVLAALCTRARRLPPMLNISPNRSPKDVTKVTLPLEGVAAIEAARASAADTCVTVTVIGRTLIRIAQHLVGFAALLEAFFGLWIVRIAVRVKLHGELAIRDLEFAVARGTLYL